MLYARQDVNYFKQMTFQFSQHYDYPHCTNKRTEGLNNLYNVTQQMMK